MAIRYNPLSWFFHNSAVALPTFRRFFKEKVMSLRAFVSVSDKRGLERLIDLTNVGWEIISTGGTATTLREKHGIPCDDVSTVTGFPEMLDGRVKTLHPKVHGGLLARKALPEHMAALREHGIRPIDLLVVNLYPFEATVAKAGCTFEEAIENIDIGGPAMVRSAAKNWEDVTVVVEPADLPVVIDEILQNGKTFRATRYKLAVKAFARIAEYDVAILAYLASQGLPAEPLAVA